MGDGDGPGGPGSPWAREVPSPASPPEISFPDPVAGPVPPDASGPVPASGAGAEEGAVPVGATPGGGPDGDPAGRSVRAPGRRWWGAVAVGLVVVIGAATIAGTDDPDAEGDVGDVTDVGSDAAPSGAAPTDFAAIDAAAADADASDVAATDAGDVTSTTFRPALTPITTFPPASDVELPRPPATWEPVRIDVPPALGRLGGELVVATADGHLVEIDLASGAADRLDLGERLAGPVLHLGATTALVVPPYASDPPVLVPSGGEPLVVEGLPDGPSGGLTVDGLDASADLYFLTAWDRPAGPRGLVVGPDGTVAELAPFGSPYGRARIVGGRTIVTDAGGVYLYDPTASLEDRVARRVSPGWLAAVGDRHLLVRECDEELRCGYAVVAVDGSSRRPAVLPDPDAVVAVAALSPDGSRMLEIPLPPDGSLPEDESDERLVDLATGRATAVDVVPPGRLLDEVVWSPDGTALVAPAPDRGSLVVVDAVTGSRTEVELDVGADVRIVGLGLRP